MNKNKILSKVKRLEEEKVGFSLKIPVSLKNDLQNLAENEKISMNSLIVMTLQSLLDDDSGKQLQVAKNLIINCKVLVEKEIQIIDEYGIDGDNVKHYQYMINTLSSINQFLKEN